MDLLDYFTKVDTNILSVDTNILSVDTNILSVDTNILSVDTNILSTKELEFTTDELADISEDILETIDEYMENEIKNMSSPTFHETMLEDIIEYYVDMWKRYGICNDQDYDTIEELVQQQIYIYFDIYAIPVRSCFYTDERLSYDKDITWIHNQIQHLQSIPQPKQKSQEWHDFRYNLITASNLSKALGSVAQQNSLIYEKCKPPDANMEKRFNNTESTMHWGVKYEPITLMIYEDTYSTKAADFGCIPHPNHSFIGASPDGINVDPANESLFGRMIEIKNIFNRDITGIPKEEYWVQCQIQMETCDLNECDFIETRFKEFESEDNFYSDTTSEYKGIILYFVQRTLGYGVDLSFSVPYNNSPVYIYLPLDIQLDKESIDAWIELQKQQNREVVLFKTIYWYLDELSCVLIQRNRRWFQSVLPRIKDTWDIILKERVSGYEHRAATKKKVADLTNKLIVEKTGGSSTHQIHNMPLTNSICLIKLDTLD
jgi:putative phage-type endonuclease